MRTCASGGPSMTERHLGPHYDPRFTLHGRQPRGKYLTRQQRDLCERDPAFAEALRQRVANPDRWEAFIARRAWYMGRVCARCGSQRRRVRSNDCYDCLLSTNRNDWSLILSGIGPPAKHSRAGYLDRLERAKRERAGECETYTCGAFTASQFPSGRLALVSVAHHINQPDLSRLDGSQVYRLCEQYPEVLEIMRWAGWTD